MSKAMCQKPLNNDCKEKYLQSFVARITQHIWNQVNNYDNFIMILNATVKNLNTFSTFKVLLVPS